MDPLKITAIGLIGAGILGLVFGSFRYLQETQEAKMRPIESLVQNKKTVHITARTGIWVIVIGSVLLLF